MAAVVEEKKLCTGCHEMRAVKHFTVVAKKEKGNSALNNKCYFPHTDPVDDVENLTCYSKETSAVTKRLTGSVNELPEVFIILSHCCCCNICRPQRGRSGSTWNVAENGHAISREEVV